MTKEKTEKKTGIAGKIDRLQKQYNKILVELFKEHAESCIEEAIEGTTGPIGSDIEGVIQTALDSLKGKVVEELGIQCGCDGMELSGDIETDIMAVPDEPVVSLAIGDDDDIDADDEEDADIDDDEEDADIDEEKDDD